MKPAEMTKTAGWEVIREALRARVGRSAYQAWFQGLDASLEERTLVLHCPDRFSRDWIRDRYGRVIQEAAASTPVMDVEYRVHAIQVPAASEPQPPAAARMAARGGADEPPRTEGFDSFVAEPGNVLALEAARAVVSGQAGRCSPLLISGGTGVGKTHLCRAIRDGIRDRVVYRSSEQFTIEVTQAIRGGRMEPLRQRYRRSLNVLILEDVHFLAGKRATQVELFHTLDHLLTAGKTVVLSTDRSLHEVSGLDAKLISRMGSGLVARITPPALETRLRILRERAASGGVGVSQECLELLASRAVDSVRDLLSGLNQVVARASLLRQPVTPELVIEALSAVEVPGRRHSLAEIKELVTRAYSLDPDELVSRSRRRRIVRPRQIAMYLCRRCTDASLKEIGQAFRRDHTSVIYAVETLERRLVEQPQLRYELEALSSRLSPAFRADSAPGSTGGTRRT